jgi:hypothetical protein
MFWISSYVPHIYSSYCDAIRPAIKAIHDGPDELANVLGNDATLTQGDILSVMAEYSSVLDIACPSHRDVDLRNKMVSLHLIKINETVNPLLNGFSSTVDSSLNDLKPLFLDIICMNRDDIIKYLDTDLSAVLSVSKYKNTLLHTLAEIDNTGSGITPMNGLHDHIDLLLSAISPTRIPLPKEPVDYDLMISGKDFVHKWNSYKSKDYAFETWLLSMEVMSASNAVPKDALLIVERMHTLVILATDIIPLAARDQHIALLKLLRQCQAWMFREMFPSTVNAAKILVTASDDTYSKAMALIDQRRDALINILLHHGMMYDTFDRLYKKTRKPLSPVEIDHEYKKILANNWLPLCKIFRCNSGFAEANPFFFRTYAKMNFHRLENMTSNITTVMTCPDYIFNQAEQNKLCSWGLEFCKIDKIKETIDVFIRTLQDIISIF